MFGIIPRETGFFDLMDEAAAVLVSAAEAYAGLAGDYGHREQYVRKIRQLEHEGDEIAHRTLEKLDQTFLTPFDREDIQALMMRMDDVIDEIDAAAKRLTLYQITDLTGWFVKQTEVLYRSSRLVSEAVNRLRNLKRPNGIQDRLVEIHRLENMGDDNNHAAVAELYCSGSDPILVMKWKEIYDLTERAIDRCEDIANAIEAILLKNT